MTLSWLPRRTAPIVNHVIGLMVALVLIIAVGDLALVAPVDAATSDNLPSLLLSAARFSVPADNTYSATLELTGADLPSDAFGQAPATTVAGSIFPASYLVTVTVYEPITSVAELDNFSADSARPLEYDYFPFNTVASQTEDGATIDIRLDGSSPAHDRRVARPGVYPIRMAFVQEGNTIAMVDTFFEQLGTTNETDSSFEAMIVARLADVGPVPTETDLDAALTNARRLLALATAVDDPISVFVAPTVIAFLRQQHPDILSQLSQALAGDIVIPLPAVQIPADTAIANELTENFGRSLATGRSIVASAFPSSTIEEAATVLDDGATPAGIALWADNGIEVAVAPADSIAAATGPTTSVDPTAPLFTGINNDRVIPVLAVSPRTQTLSDPLNVAETPTSRAVELLAFVAVDHAAAPGSSSFVLTTPDLMVPNPDIIAAMSASIDDPRWEWAAIDDRSLSTEQPPADDRTNFIEWQEPVIVDLSQRVDRLKGARLIVADVLSMVPDDDERRTRWPSTLNSALSTAIPDEVAIESIDQLIAETAALKGSVHPPEAFNFTLTGSDSTLRFQLTNNADVPLKVVVEVTSDRISASNETAIELAPSAVNDVAIDVTTRSNGTANLRIALRTPAGNLIGEPVAMTGRVNTYSGLGQLFSVGALLVLLTWWITHLRSRRRRSLQTSGSEDDALHNDG